MRRPESPDLAIVAISKGGASTGSRLAQELKSPHLYVATKVASHARNVDVHQFELPVAALLKELFPRYRKLVLFVALGAAVRLLAPLVQDKKTDPAVVVVDDSGKYAISVLSGHIGGANDLARKVAGLLGAEAVVTTASDVAGTIAPDLMGRDLGWVIENRDQLTRAASAMVNGEPVGLYQDAGERSWWDRPLPDNVTRYSSLESLAESSSGSALVITDRLLGPEHAGFLRSAVVYRPKTLVLGVGCNRGAGRIEVEETVSRVLQDNSLSMASVRNVATIDIKRNEDGILDFARLHGLPITYFNSGELEAVPDIPNPSEAIRKIVGARGVCEPAAMLSAGTRTLVVEKTKKGNVTVAVARVEAEPLDMPGQQQRTGVIYVVGLGPGAKDQMTYRARQALSDSDVIVGYKTYLNLIKDLLAGKEVISSGMRQEVPRARKAVELAEAGRKVAVVSSGDAGVYGMAGLVYEVTRAQGWAYTGNIEVVPGVSALNAAAALLGAPLMHDFAAISLSDLLTPWDRIARRLRSAAEGDFVIALYNPRSGRRTQQIQEARRVLLEYRSGSTPVGLVTNAYRDGQTVVVSDLDHMLDFEIGMLTVVIVGNSETTSFGDVMVTPRGYEEKYDLTDGASGD